jgi:hypothetical protein
LVISVISVKNVKMTKVTKLAEMTGWIFGEKPPPRLPSLQPPVGQNRLHRFRRPGHG